MRVRLRSLMAGSSGERKAESAPAATCGLDFYVKFGVWGGRSGEAARRPSSRVPKATRLASLEAMIAPTARGLVAPGGNDVRLQLEAVAQQVGKDHMLARRKSTRLLEQLGDTLAHVASLAGSVWGQIGEAVALPGTTASPPN
jgi:hypothetical protein